VSLSNKFKDWLHKDVEVPKATKLQEQMSRGIARLKVKMGPCPACGKHRRGVVGSLFELREKGQDPKGETLTVAVLLCYDCGHVNMFESSALELPA